MENMLKTLIIVTLIFYLLKGLIYLILWQMTYKVQEKALAAKAKAKKEKKVEKETWNEGE
ncbi:MAG TPA: hypothetical protein VFD02_04425 [Syntrophomonadaceae bacterium]|nr:hypothetical protein [Syntrophomonadaceae bacterium]